MQPLSSCGYLGSRAGNVVVWCGRPSSLLLSWMATSKPSPKWDAEEATWKGQYLEKFTEKIKIKELSVSMRVEKALHRPSSLSSKSSRSSPKGSGKNKGSRDGGSKEDGRVRRLVHPQKVLSGSQAWLAPVS